MDFNYFLADPAGNVTVLVENPVDPSRLTEVGSALLSLEKSAEQVGFLSPAPVMEGICLRMAGGEFCGNATLSAGACRLSMDGISSGSVPVFVYGVRAPLTVSVREVSDSVYEGVADMPLPEEVSDISLSFEGKTYPLGFVSFGGIAHLITEQTLDAASAEAAIRQWSRELSVPALGLISVDRTKSALTPLVYVPALDSLYWEKSCASGTCAAAVWFARGGSAYREFSEPGGTLGCETGPSLLRLHNTVCLEHKTLQI